MTEPSADTPPTLAPSPNRSMTGVLDLLEENELAEQLPARVVVGLVAAADGRFDSATYRQSSDLLVHYRCGDALVSRTLFVDRADQRWIVGTVSDGPARSLVIPDDASAADVEPAPHIFFCP